MVRRLLLSDGESIVNTKIEIGEEGVGMVREPGSVWRHPTFEDEYLVNNSELNTTQPESWKALRSKTTSDYIQQANGEWILVERNRGKDVRRMGGRWA